MWQYKIDFLITWHDENYFVLLNFFTKNNYFNKIKLNFIYLIKKSKLRIPNFSLILLFLCFEVSISSSTTFVATPLSFTKILFSTSFEHKKIQL